MNWRWDQGRLRHFAFDNIRAAARALLPVNGIELAASPDPLRLALTGHTTAAFLPLNYRVWRNHKRVFECNLIATNIDRRLQLTDLGRRLASNEPFTADDYLSLITQRFRYPFPAFEDYDPTEPLCFPFCAALKYLFARLTTTNLPPLTVEAVAAFLVGNACTGIESLEHYASLTATSHTLAGDAERQAREMLIFISQFSFLKWVNQTLVLDLQTNAPLDALLAVVVPDMLPPLALRPEELLNRARLAIGYEPAEISLPESEDSTELEFSEGQKVRRSHLRVERSPLLRKVYFKKFAPAQCDMCRMNVTKQYPWTNRSLLELHHLLPLSSALAVNKGGTLLTDVVPLCPTCHRGIHAYYRVWLNASSRQDFADKPEARQVYEDAKSKIVLP